MRVHIEGMGVNGCLLARLLDHRGIDFTWHDTHAKATAWKACTGAIYPSGSTKFGPDEPCRERWLEWYAQGLLPKRAIERGRFVFSTKQPPHGGKYPFGTVNGLGVAAPPSLHINAQTLVQQTRALFARKRLAEYDHQATHYIVSHGFGERYSHSYWGWTRLVELDHDLNDGDRPAFYFRKGRFVMAYAYPVPGSNLWYAGSSIIKQRGEARSYEIMPKYQKWRENFLALGGGNVEIKAEHEFLEGWRPAAADTDKDWIRVTQFPGGGKLIKLRPLWNSGVRHFPVQWEAVRRVLGVGA